jgi:hypothetical protein
VLSSMADKLTIALKNQRHATRTGGYYSAIIGGVRRGGQYSSYQADLIARMPRKELQAVLIKQQFNVASNGPEYALRLPRASCTNTSSCGSGGRPSWRRGRRVPPVRSSSRDRLS